MEWRLNQDLYTLKRYALPAPPSGSLGNAAPTPSFSGASGAPTTAAGSVPDARRAAAALAYPWLSIAFPVPRVHPGHGARRRGGGGGTRKALPGNGNFPVRPAVRAPGPELELVEPRPVPPLRQYIFDSCGGRSGRARPGREGRGVEGTSLPPQLAPLVARQASSRARQRQAGPIARCASQRVNAPSERGRGALR